MATKRKSNGNGARKSTARGRAAQSGRERDAISLLKADHRQVEAWFEEFKKARSEERKSELADSICNALKVHTQIEEEIFYPAFLEGAGDENIHHEAEVEHQGAKNLISEIEQGGSSDEYFDAKVKVLAEMIKHHVKEEEKRDGMFAKARQAGLPLAELGERLAERKAQLEGQVAAWPDSRQSEARMR